MEPHRKLTHAEFMAEAKELFGDDPKTYAFRCPACGDVATIKDFIDLSGGTRAGQECIGRLLGAKPYWVEAREKKRGCDWAAYGLLPGPWEVVMPAEGDEPERSVYSFPFAEVA